MHTGCRPNFLVRRCLQESAYDPAALSTAGAIGIAQFMPETAADVGLDPYDPFASIAAAAALLGGYVARLCERPTTTRMRSRLRHTMPVRLRSREYRGVPPYAETREYIALIYDRWARIASYENDRAHGRRRP